MNLSDSKYKSDSEHIKQLHYKSINIICHMPTVIIIIIMSLFYAIVIRSTSPVAAVLHVAGVSVYSIPLINVTKLNWMPA